MDALPRLTAKRQLRATVANVWRRNLGSTCRNTRRLWSKSPWNASESRVSAYHHSLHPTASIFTSQDSRPRGNRALVCCLFRQREGAVPKPVRSFLQYL